MQCAPAVPEQDEVAAMGAGHTVDRQLALHHELGSVHSRELKACHGLGGVKMLIGGTSGGL
jgi:hypothetical protein